MCRIIQIRGKSFEGLISEVKLQDCGDRPVGVELQIYNYYVSPFPKVF